MNEYLDWTEEQKREWVSKFEAEIREVMARYRVRAFIADDHYPGYPECGEDIRITVDFESPYIDHEWRKSFYLEP